jgi:hypothetical protein
VAIHNVVNRISISTSSALFVNAGLEFGRQERGEGTRMTNNRAVNMEYTRRLYQNALDWYQNADSKAQVVLGIDGVFVAFVSGTAFAKPQELRAILGHFPTVAWILLACMVASLVVSMGAAIYCLWSRIYSERHLAGIIDAAVEKAKATGRGDMIYPPAISCFFQFIERLDRDKFRETLRSVDSDFEIAALASQIHIVSGNIRKKHSAVNLGFVFAAIALLMLFGTVASYVLVVV